MHGPPGAALAAYGGLALPPAIPFKPCGLGEEPVDAETGWYKESHLGCGTPATSRMYAHGMAQTLTRLLVHVVFSTKGRSPLIVPEMENDLHKYLAGIARNHDSPLLAAGGTADHIHLLVAQSKNIALASLLMHLKKDSSKWIKTRSPRAFAWQEGYGAFTLGASQLPAATRYIARQKEHHRRASFQDELRALCRKYDVALDEQHAWT